MPGCRQGAWSSDSAWGRQIRRELCLSVALITALLHWGLPEGTFARSESGAFLHLIALTKTHSARGHEKVPGVGRASAIAHVLAAEAAPASLALGGIFS